jgi:hypothetical protein
LVRVGVEFYADLTVSGLLQRRKAWLEERFRLSRFSPLISHFHNNFHQISDFHIDERKESRSQNQQGEFFV